MLTLLAKFLKALNSESGAWALAFAFVLGNIKLLKKYRSI